MSSQSGSMDAAMRKQQEELDRMQEEEERKNKLVQERSIRNLKMASGGGGFRSDTGTKDTLG